MAFGLNVGFGSGGRGGRRPQAAPVGLRAAGGDGGDISRGDRSRVALSGSSASPQHVKPCIPLPARGRPSASSAAWDTTGWPRGLRGDRKSHLWGDAKTSPRQGWWEQCRYGEQERRPERGWEDPRRRFWEGCGADAPAAAPALGAGPAAARRQQSVRGEKPVFIAPLVGTCFLVSDCKQI